MNTPPLQARPYRNVHLPLERSNEGLSNDAAYLQSALEQIATLERFVPITPATRFLDFGCGQGRLANGLLSDGRAVARYVGIDTVLEPIQWCRRWIAPGHPGFEFLHVPAYNLRYNTTARAREPLPVSPAGFDIAFVNSVFSHMLAPDVTFYLGQLHAALDGGGLLYLTAFLEPDVPPVEENPAGYLGRTPRRPLARVRYEQDYFLGLVRDAGFEVLDFMHRGIARTQQSVVVAQKSA